MTGYYGFTFIVHMSIHSSCTSIGLSVFLFEDNNIGKYGFSPNWHCGDLGLVVQSVVRLTSALRVISLTVLADSIYSILIFFAEKMWVAFALHCKSYSHFFSKKFQHICVSLDVNFNESLTNDVVSFEQLGPDVFLISPQTIHCWYSLEAYCWGASNKYTQRRFLWWNKENNYLISIWTKVLSCFAVMAQNVEILKFNIS